MCLLQYTPLLNSYLAALTARADYERFLGYFRGAYQNDPRWREPDGVTTKRYPVVVNDDRTLEEME